MLKAGSTAPPLAGHLETPSLRDHAARNAGISFGGVIAFIFADLIILPIINSYRKYYGWRTALYLTSTFYVTMVTAGYAIEILFDVTGLTRTQRDAKVVDAGITWNYTTWLNIAFLILAVVLTVRFFRTGGRSMLAMMGGNPGHGHSKLHAAA